MIGAGIFAALRAGRRGGRRPDFSSVWRSPRSSPTATRRRPRDWPPSIPCPVGRTCTAAKGSATFWGYLAGWGFVIGKTASCAAMALTVGLYLWPDHAHAVAVAAVVLLTAVNCLGVTKSAAGHPADRGRGAGRSGGGRRHHAHLGRDAGRVGSIRSPTSRQPECSRPPDCCSSHLPDTRGSRPWVRRYAIRPGPFRGRSRWRWPSRCSSTWWSRWRYSRAGRRRGGRVGRTVGRCGGRRRGRPGSNRWSAIGAVVAALGSMLAVLLGVSRTTIAMARDRHLPHPLAAVHRTTGVPYRAELVDRPGGGDSRRDRGSA